MKQFSRSMYAGRDGMRKAMVEYIRELEARVEGNEAELQEKLRQQHDQTIVELAEWCNEEDIPLDKTSRLVFSADKLLIDNNGEEG